MSKRTLPICARILFPVFLASALLLTGCKYTESTASSAESTMAEADTISTDQTSAAESTAQTSATEDTVQTSDTETADSSASDTVSDDNRFIAYVRNDCRSGDEGTIEYKKMLMIGGDDTETLKKYNIDPADVTNDYALVELDTDWTQATWSSDTTFVVQYSQDHMYLEQHYPDCSEFEDYMTSMDTEDTPFQMLAYVTLSDTDSNAITRIEEIYVP